MNAQDAMKFARRFIELSPEKRRLFLAGLQQEGVDFSLFPIPADVAGSDRDGLSYAQRRMAFLWQLDPRGAAYNLPMAVRLNGPLDIEALHRAFDQLVARHESLRTRLRADGEHLLQEVLEPLPVAITRHELRDSSNHSEREAQVVALAEAEAQAPFDLLQGPLLRVHLLQLAAEEHVLLLTLHHIVADGWSLNVLIDEFVGLYDAACNQTEAQLLPLPIQYRDFALWQRSWLEAGEQERQLAYWRDKLGDDHTPLALPFDHPRPATPSQRGRRHEFEVEPALAERLGALAKASGVTLFMLLLASFKLLLQRYSGQASIRVGVPVANRHRGEVEGLIGCFINTQVLHTEIDPLMDVSELLRRIKDTALGAQAHQDLPFERLVEALELARSASHSPLFQVLFNHQAAIADAGQIRLRSGLSLEKVALDQHSARFDLSLDTYESAGRLHGIFTYAVDVFDAQTIATLSQHWLQLLDGMACAPDAVVGELALALPVATATPVAMPNESLCIHHLIEGAATADPLQVAAVSGSDCITYEALQRRSDALAQQLLDAGVQLDERVGVLADRSIEMLVALLAVLKVGAAYLPLEPDQPQARLHFMLADSAVKRVLGRAGQIAGLPAHIEWVNLAADYRAVPLRRVAVHAANLAYVIYTSGTTGLPKGVAVSHGALVNYVQGVSRHLALDTLERLAMVTTPAADLGHTLLFGALCAGKTLHMLGKDSVLDAEVFAAYMSEHAIDALKIVPSHLQAMLAAGAAALPRHCLIVGGEACTAALLNRVAALAPGLRVINHYGPTETTVGVLTHVLGTEPVLGRPLDNIRTAVLDSCLQAVPGATRGELYIGGAGLARGYLRRPGLTAERFVPDPDGAPGTRLYRSGDWVRQNREGELLFAGRIDGQVKIRGYRVELAEIDSCLRQLPGIDNVLVQIVGDDSNRQLAAWLVPQAWSADERVQRIFTETVRASLKQTLPEHLLPHYLMLLPQLPVTANGKVDIKALPQPLASVSEYRAPVTALQVQVAAIWAQVLQAGQVGLDDNFFALGGHSLLATQVVSRIRHQLQLDVALRVLFDTADLHDFTQALQGLVPDHGGEIRLLDRSQPLPVSHAQYRQWMFWQLNPASSAYNTPLAVKLQGALDRPALQAAFDGLLARHESLRTLFDEKDGLPWQRVLPAAPLAIDWHDLTGESAQSIRQRLDALFASPMDLAHGPLIRVCLFKTAVDEHVLAVLLHHIVSDGWSMSVMVRELAGAYNAQVSGQDLHVEALAVQYADYAGWQREHLASGQLQAQLAFWKNTLQDDFAVLQLPADHLRPQVQSYRGGRVDVRLPAGLTANLRRLALQSNATLFHVFLASFALLLSRYSGRATLNIGVPVTHRNRLELEGLMGFFVNTIIARIEVSPAQPFSQLLAAVKEITLQAQANKDIPFDVLVEELKPERDLGHNPLFQVMYNHLQDLGERVSSDSVHGLRVEEVEWVEQTTQFDLSLDTLERSDGVTASFSYAADLFERERIEGLAGHWLTLLGSLGQSAVAVAELPLLEAAQYQQLIAGAKPLHEGADSQLCAHQLIELQVQRQPDAVALVLGAQTLSYGQLNRRANRLAHRLREAGVGPDVRVGIAVERGLEMVVGLLGILKAGGAYVPLDPAYPQDRLTHMLEDSGIGLLLTQPALQQQLAFLPGVQRLELAPGDDWLAGYSETDPVNSAQPASLAYVIYTSGSTGKPKGVGIAHGELSVFCRVAADYSQLSARDKVLQFATVSFDGFVEQLYPALCCGAQVVMRGPQLWDIETLTAAIIDHGVTVADLPTAYWRLFAAHMRQASSCGVLRQVHVGGEAMPPEGLNDWFASGLKHVRLLNTYGPTEATVVATVFECTASDMGEPGKASVPIGKAIGGRATYLCDSGFALAPAGIVSELLIGGRGCLARGYFNRPALTAERFVPDPFDTSAAGGGRLYRSGDLARYRGDGVLEYSGRIDHQVKIRGFRVELGEVEARLLEHPAVREAVVLAQQGSSGMQLVGYVVPADATVLHSAEAQTALRETLRAALKQSLPEPMLPTWLLILEKLALTANGKLDRKALPQADASVLQHRHVAPRTAVEQQIAAIWAQVLELERVGLTDHFFELGGHSLLATRMVSRVRQGLGIEVPLRSVFEAPLLADFAEWVTRLGTDSVGALVAVARDQPLALSYGQQRHWFLWQLDPTSAAYHIPAVLRLQGVLDIEALQHSFNALIARHEPLRTTFMQEGEQVTQRIHAHLPFELIVQRLDETAVQASVEAEIRRPFDLQHGPLLRVRLLRLAEDEHLLVLTQHHIVADGWSIPIMVDELLRFYEGYLLGQVVSLPALPVQYVDYAIWQRQWLEAGERERQLAYWQAQLGGEQPVLQLPTDHPRPNVLSHTGARVAFAVDADLTRELKSLAQRHDVTLFVVLLASFQTLLQRYSGQADIRVGVPIANRTRLETERLIGFFVNTQVLKAEFDPQTTVATLLQQVKQRALGAQMHQDLPFEQLVEALQPERSLSHSPLFQVMYNHQAQGASSARTVAGLVLEDWPLVQRTSQFDLTLDTVEGPAGLQAALTYATDLFDEPTIERLGRHWLTLLHSIVRQPQQRIARLELLQADEQRQIIEDWNGKQARYPAGQCLHQLIEQQVRRAPEATALVSGEQRLSYAQLNRRANRLAHKLRERGVGPDVLVGVALERSLEMVIALLAILKAGGAYVPLDPHYPQDRLAYMLQDSGVRLLLTQACLRGQLALAEEVECLDVGAGDKAWSDYSDADLPSGVVAQNLAYVIYTSGSTGRPKGTLLTHHNVVRLFAATQDGFQFNADDVWTVFHSYAFDFSVWELFGALVHGGRAVVVARDVSRSPEEFHALLVREQVTVLNQTPSAFKQLIPIATAAARSGGGLALRYVVFGGEALDVASLAPWFERFGDSQPRLINMYGITETTVHVSYRPLARQDLHGNVASPLGGVIPDLSWYVLGADCNLTAPGCQGELYVGQAGLARGYFNRPGLTAERFIPDPFDTSEHGGARLYRSGDLARYRSDGVIEYSGRIDQQVKIRGLRIELGEIEARLQEHAAVREAVVLAQEGPGGAQLVGYVVPADAAVLQNSAAQFALRDSLRAALKVSLADYMVPAHLLFLEKLALTANGKLDRKALPQADASLLQQRFVAPLPGLEQQVAAIWAEVLKLDRVSRSDHFFELGGHSLLATQVIARLRQQDVPGLKLRDVFDHPCLADFARALGAAQSVEQPAAGIVLKACPGKTTAPLSLVQRRLWMVEQLAPGAAAYGMPMALRLRGELSLTLLHASLQALVRRHEVLRTSYGQDEEGEAIALIRPELTVELPFEDLSAVGRAGQDERIASLTLANEQHPFVLDQAPLLRMQVVRLGPQEHVLFYSMHHIISDGWSMAVLANELVQVYERLRKGDDTPLPALPVQYSDFAVWQQALERAGALRQQAQYWKTALHGYPGQLLLPVRQPRAVQASHAGGCVSFQLSAGLSQGLTDLAARSEVTLYTLMLAAFHAFLHRLTASDDVVVGVDYAGRQQAELEGLIGFFVNVLPLRSQHSAGMTFATLLGQIRDRLLSAFEHQDLPFDMIVEAAQVPRHKGISPLVQVLFVMNNVPLGGQGIDGLSVEPLPGLSEHSKFDMALFIEQGPDAVLRGQWRFASALLEQAAVQRFVDGWSAILEYILCDQNLRLEDMHMPMENTGAITPPAAAAGPKANKLDQFLKKPLSGKSPSPIRESLLVPTQDFPLLLEPTDPGLDVVRWVASNRPYIEEKLARHGGILFRGFAVPDSQAFEAFAEAVQPGLYGNYGDLPKKEGGQNTYRSTPYPEKKMILFHNESAHQDSWPRKQLFYCEQPSPVGGATPVVDCRQLYHKLPPALRERLESKGLLYVRTFTGKLDVSWQHFFKTTRRSEVEARCAAAGIQWRWLADDELQIRTPCPAIITHPLTGARSFFNQVQLHHIHCLDSEVREDLLALFGIERMPRNVYYGDGAPIESEVMELIGELYEACAVRFDWRKGDVILVDNMLVAHARDPYEGPRKIVVAMGDMVTRASLATVAVAGEVEA